MLKKKKVIKKFSSTNENFSKKISSKNQELKKPQKINKQQKKIDDITLYKLMK